MVSLKCIKMLWFLHPIWMQIPSDQNRQHFNRIFIVSFQIKCAGIQGQNNQNGVTVQALTDHITVYAKLTLNERLTGRLPWWLHVPVLVIQHHVCQASAVAVRRGAGAAGTERDARDEPAATFPRTTPCETTAANATGSGDILLQELQRIASSHTSKNALTIYIYTHCTKYKQFHHFTGNVLSIKSLCCFSFFIWKILPSL